VSVVVADSGGGRQVVVGECGEVGQVSGVVVVAE
jgi:hypothetical protein